MIAIAASASHLHKSPVSAELPEYPLLFTIKFRTCLLTRSATLHYHAFPPHTAAAPHCCTMRTTSASPFRLGDSALCGTISHCTESRQKLSPAKSCPPHAPVQGQHVGAHGRADRAHEVRPKKTYAHHIGRRGGITLPVENSPVVRIW